MEELRAALHALWTRVGEPSVRQIDALTAKSGPRMPSSTVHNKLFGTSRLRPDDVTRLVQALIKHAENRGADLSPEETDVKAWRKRAEEAGQAVRVRQDAASRRRRREDPASRYGWKLEPLRAAGLDDIIDLIEQSADKPMAQWIPRVLTELGLARMSTEDYLATIAVLPPKELAAVIDAIARLEDDPAEAFEKLIALCATRQPPEAIPKITAALRRGDEINSWAFADDLIRSIPLSRTLDLSLTDEDPGSRIVKIVQALRSATHHADARVLLEGIGREGEARLVITSAGMLRALSPDDRQIILHAIGQGDPNRTVKLLKSFMRWATSAVQKEEDRLLILSGAPEEKREEVNELLASRTARPPRPDSHQEEAQTPG